MTARFRSLTWGCVLTLLAASAAAAQHFPSNDSLTAILRSRVGTRGVGMVLGVMEPNGAMRIVSYGSPGLGAKPLGPKSIFEMGSITKVFTGILLADLVDRGQVALSDPVQKYLPAGVKMPSRNGREITLLDLATHRSSLTRMPTNIVAEGGNPYPKYTIPEMYAFLNGHQLRRDIGSEYEYSNIAVALLGHVIERVAGAPYEQLIQERILRPLGMTMSSTQVEGALKEWMTIGHDESGFVAPYRGWLDLPGMGALRSNAEDMLRFLAANANPPDNRLGRAMRAAQQVRNTINPGTDIGLNWQVLKFGAKRIIEHGGATVGFRAFAGFDPETKVGAVILANYPAAMADIVVHLINPSFPLSGATVAADRVQIDVPESVLRRYVGDYEFGPTLSINVTLDNGALFAQATAQNRLPIFPESETKFFYRNVNAQLSFVRDSSGAVTGVLLHQGGRDQPGRRRTVPGVALAATVDTASLPGRRVSIPSQVLGGSRALRILLPPGYELSQSTRFPVLYVLDGERPLHLATTVVRQMAQRLTAPDMIVVHVGAPSTGGDRAAFARFLTDELQPYMTREFRTAPLNIAVGSPEVLAATNAFSAKIAFAANQTASASFGGQTQTPIPATDPYPTLTATLGWVFSEWQLPNLAGLAAQPDGTGWPTIDAHLAKLSARYGYRVVPPEDLVDNAAGTLLQQRRFDDVIRTLEKNKEYHPGSAVAWNHLGDGYRALCRWAESKEHYTKARDLARAMAYGNLSNYEMELNRITQEIDSGRQCTSPATTRPSVTVSEAILKTYVGEYEFSARVTISVTLEAGALHAQPSGQNKLALRAESDTTFFSENGTLRATFTKDASGGVTGMMLNQGGRELVGRKVK